VRRLRLLLDTNVLVDAQIRDLFLRLAEAELIDICWSGEILEELRRTLVTKMGKDAVKVDRLVNLLVRAFPDA
jgi:predicted nucleic acid-binding protein